MIYFTRREDVEKIIVSRVADNKRNRPVVKEERRIHMKRSRRALTSLVLLFSLLLTLVSSALAIDQDVNSESVLYSETGMTEYAHSMAVSYLRASSLLDGEGTYFLSQAFPIEGDNDPYNHIFFVFANTESIGYLIVSYVGNEYSSSFVHRNIPDFNNINQSNMSLQVRAHDNGLYVWNQTQYIKISGTNSQEPDMPAHGVVLKTSSVRLNELSVQYVATRGSSAQIVLPNFPITENFEILLTGPTGNIVQRGACWVACAAAVGQYETGTAVSPRTLYNWAKSNIPNDGELYIGSAEDTRNTINEYYDLNYVVRSNPLNAGSIWNEMVDRSPVIAGISYTTDGVRHGHMVVICGATLSGNEYYYTLMDPNEPSYVMVYVGEASKTQFTYVSNTGTYTTCEVNIYR